MYRFNKTQQQTLKEAVNPHDIARKDRQTTEDYIRRVGHAKPNVDQMEMIEKMEKNGLPNKIRRKIEEGSYDNHSVDEQSLLKKRRDHTTVRLEGKAREATQILARQETPPVH
jgi:hypothetical protein